MRTVNVFAFKSGQKIGFGFEDLPNQSTRIVGTCQVFAEQRNQTALGPIGNHLDGIDEVLALGAQPREAFLFTERLDANVYASACAAV